MTSTSEPETHNANWIYLIWRTHISIDPNIVDTYLNSMHIGTEHQIVTLDI